MLKILFKISKNLENIYLKSLKDTIETIKKETELKKIEFELYEFTRLEELKITVSRNAFVNSKIAELNSSNFNSIIYIPDTRFNLKGNYLWYSVGPPKKQMMIVSSFLYKELINEKVDFGSYILILYLQYLARFAVDLEIPHDSSRNCLNDHCGEQSELLNVLKNEEDGLCEECSNKIKDKKYFTVIKEIINILKRKYPGSNIIKKIGEKSIPSKVKHKESEIEMVPDHGHWYEFEIYMAKKCSNLSKLYTKLDLLLKNYNSKIKGYSLYEVSGGWRSDLKGIEEDDWELLCKLEEKFNEKENLKGVIRPLIKSSSKKGVVFDETSIVLRIIVNLEDYKDNINNIFNDSDSIINDIKDIFEEVMVNEQSILFTLKKLEISGNILKKGKK